MDLHELRIYGDPAWARRVPKRADGAVDPMRTLGNAFNAWTYLKRLRADFAAELIAAKGRYTPEGLLDALPKIADRFRVEMDKQGKVAEALARKADELIGQPKALDLDPIVLELRGREIRERLLATLPGEADLTITGTGARRWIAERYAEAIDAGDLVTVHAIETTPSVYPEAVRLSADELRDFRLARAEAENPKAAREARDLQEALADMAKAAAILDDDLSTAERRAITEGPDRQAAKDNLEQIVRDQLGEDAGDADAA